MTASIPSFVVFAMAQSTSGSQNVLLQLVPFGLMIGVFYLIVLMPMQRRQKKVKEFQESLKVGERVITTSGIYGVITKVDGTSVQIQIADKVRIDVARASIGGYQGQEPVVQERGAL
jgi:preprotein translocase subunit YajC